MKRLLYNLSGWKIKEEPNYIIWGAGVRGKILLSYIRKISNHIFFADNDIEKQGKRIEGIICISKKEVEDRVNKSIVIVSPEKSDDLYNELSEICPYIISEIIFEILDYYPKAHGYNYHMPIGHFFSLYPKLDEVKEKRTRLYNVDKEIKDIDLNAEKQMEIFNYMKGIFSTVPKWEENNNLYRYKTISTSYAHSDAICLNLMLRMLKPKNIIEVGSGWSSAVMLDTNEFYCDNQLRISFIEPYPDLLKKIMKQEDKYEINSCQLQDINVDYFEKLDKGDILFIDSTHVSKMGSDVNYLFFEILPRLKKGVYVHFHDIFYPFEYPFEWVEKEGYIWNEIYLLRAFLMNSTDYKIIFWGDYMKKLGLKKVEESMNIYEKMGNCFWIEKV